MFAKALVIATATALKLQATVELSSLAGVNIKALSTQELAQLRAGTQEAFEQYKSKFAKTYLTEEESTARQDQWLECTAADQTFASEDPSWQTGDNQLCDMTQEETDAMKGTHELQAAPENERYPDPSHPIDEDNVTMLAKTGDTWNTVYPGSNSTYQYIYDLAFRQAETDGNGNYGCNSFDAWDTHWLEQVGYRSYYEYYVERGYCSDAYLRNWWNEVIISWRQQLRDYLQCADDSQQDDSNDDSSNDDSTPNVNDCDSIDSAECIWGDEFVVPIKNQGSCGSCYAFSTTQILESYNAIAGNGLVSLSEQQIVDCGYGNNYGCNGGWPASVLNTVASSQYALWPEEDYEYVARVESCESKSATTRVKTSGSSQRVKSNSVTAMKQALMNGPLAITVDANQKFMSYSGGILRDCVYGQLNHAVNAIGWTIMDGVEVVKVRNSWGTWWGDEGYVYVAIDTTAAAENNGKGPCGILEHLYWADATTA